MRPRLLRFVGEMECRPRGYGRAWRCVDRWGWMMAPIPLNLVLSWTRSLYWWLGTAVWESPLEQMWAKGYAVGLRHAAAAQEDARDLGYAEGHAAGFLEGQEAEATALVEAFALLERRAPPIVH